MLSHSKQRTYTGGPQVVPAPQTVLAASTFNGIYMRPNISNGGAIPTTGSLSGCPDIWPNNTTPVANFQNALATTQSYQTPSPSAITLQMDNYIYVRGCNGASTNKSVNVTLYYAPSGVIQHPSYWEGNVIATDQNNRSANITNLAPGAIGVADQTFVWKQVQPPPGGSDHYCLIAQFNDANNSNPIPDPSTQLDLAALITNNLGWGWHNVSLVSAPAGFAWQYSTGLNIPLNFPAAPYFIFVSPVGYTGWSVSYQCSQNDSKGKPISLPKTTITGDGLLYGGTPCYLEPGYNALVSVYMYNDNNVSAQPGAHVPLKAQYPSANNTEHLEAVRRGLVDWATTRYARQRYHNIPIQSVLPLGQVTGQTTSTSLSGTGKLSHSRYERRS